MVVALLVGSLHAAEVQFDASVDVDGALDIVLWHRLRLGVIDRQPQARVHIRIGSAHLCSYRDFTAQL